MLVNLPSRSRRSHIAERSSRCICWQAVRKLSQSEDDVTACEGSPPWASGVESLS